MEDKGIVGALKLFREMVKELELKEGQKIVFMGCVGTCLPFAELLAFAIRDLGLDMSFVPDVNVEDTRQLEMVKGLGVQASGKMDPKSANVLVLLGGLAMPKSKLTLSDVLRRITEVLASDGKVVGFCFNNTFRKSGWEEKIPFSYIIDAQMESVELNRF